MNWFRIDLKSGGARFIETNLEFKDFMSLVVERRLIPVRRQVLPIPIQNGQNNQLTFAVMDKVNPLMSSCKPDTNYIVSTDIVGFGEVDTDTDLWKVVRESALGEVVIATPDQGLIIPSGGQDG